MKSGSGRSLMCFAMRVLIWLRCEWGRCNTGAMARSASLLYSFVNTKYSKTDTKKTAQIQNIAFQKQNTDMKRGFVIFATHLAKVFAKTSFICFSFQNHKLHNIHINLKLAASNLAQIGHRLSTDWAKKNDFCKKS